MGRKVSEKTLMLLRIERARIELNADLYNGLVTEADIYELFNCGLEFGLSKSNDIKIKRLKEIFNCPFLLCDQDILSFNMKKLLPMILKSRYTTEVEELYKLYEDGLMSPEELLNRKELIKFAFYNTSKEGKYILKNGHVKQVKDNVLRAK